MSTPADVFALVEAQVPHARAMLEHAERVEAEETVRDLEASIRLVRIDKARAAYEAAKARLFSWTPGDTAGRDAVLTDLVGAGDALIAALETPAAR